MVHIPVAQWRERWVAWRRSGRHKGVWDDQLLRESIQLRDGRRLSYFLDGPVHTTSPKIPSLQAERAVNPVSHLPHIFVFHALFLSGNAFLMGNRPKDYVLVCVNRPGYFESDAPPRISQVDGSVDDNSFFSYSYETFAHDMEQLADHLGLVHYYVAGHSSGGPCALACAAYHPQRVRAVGILASDPEYAHHQVPNKHWYNDWLVGCFLPILVKYVLFFLPFARGVRHGIQQDYQIETRPYSFDTECIRQPVISYLAEKDTVLPWHVTRHVHDRLDNVQLTVVPAIGHLGLLNDFVLRDFFLAVISHGEAKLDTESLASTNEWSSADFQSEIEMNID